MILILKFLRSCQKELVIVSRDKAGLLLLFFMPMALVLAAALIQDNILSEDRRTKFQVLFLDEDKGLLGANLEKGIRAAGYLEMRQVYDGRSLTETSLHRAVANGDFQIGIIAHRGASQSIKSEVRNIFERSGTDARPAKRITLVFDPVVKEGMQILIENSVHLLVLKTHQSVFLKEIATLMPMLSGSDDQSADDASPFEINLDPAQGIEKEFASFRDVYLDTNAVQHNVPAWSLFGIFFIILPLSGSIFRERQDQTLARLMTIPVSFGVFYLGKIVAYSLINLIQLGFMLLVGVAILPLLGLPALNLGNQPELILFVGISAALAATGYGLMLGTIFQSYEQASVFGPISVVIAAILGGLMVPAFLMPEIMQKVAEFSPMHWGYIAFIDIFVRGVGFKALIPNIAKLLAFFAVTLTISLISVLRSK